MEGGDMFQFDTGLAMKSGMPDSAEVSKNRRSAE
ncbi:hypothetical protein FHS42_000971 [Streptomyces zagrosensis]|uniref:Uncharacterized protein n=1 Tax=Streptomyces zagrosensis TaxID=1042984 RepID=A0A7W9UWI7_9ACTN|nr:hypothetical protein [Streptomyces zagrosensis]